MKRFVKAKKFAFMFVLVGGMLVCGRTAVAANGLPAVQDDIEQLRDLICDATYAILGADQSALVALPRQFCDDTCPCFDAEALLASGETSCLNASGTRQSLPNLLFLAQDRGLNTADGPKRFAECRSPDGLVAITRRQAADCIRIMEETLGSDLFGVCD